MIQLIKWTTAILLFVLTTLNPLIAQKSVSTLDGYFTKLFENGQLNGNVLVADNGRIIYEKSFGYADFATKKLNSSKSSFPIASITKTFTATAILQLTEKGKLQIDDAVVKYLPIFPYPSITIKHLLSHTSGLPSYDALFDSLRSTNPDTVFTNSDILPRYAAEKKRLLYQPGDSGNYDNINFIFLALVVEKVSGEAFNNYLRKHILVPAGMKNTILPGFAFYHYTQKEKRNLSNTFRYPYYYSVTPERTDTISFVSKYWHNYNFKGFGEIVTTVRDLLKYDQALYNGTLLRDETMREAFTSVKLNNGKINHVGNGLGWQIAVDTSFGKRVSHTGGIIGLSSVLLKNVSKHQTVIIIDNVQNGVYDIANDALKILNGKHVSLPKQSVAKLYGRTLMTRGIPEARKLLQTVKKDTVNYLLTEFGMNLLGYQLMQANMDDKALEVFKTDLELFPLSWNVYDSYGEMLLKFGQKEEAIKMYRRSLDLNPANENGMKMLKQILEK